MASLTKTKLNSCSQSFGGYPHGFVLNERCFNRFFARYHAWYGSRTGRRFKPWLPRTWQTSIAGQKPESSIKAELNSILIELLPDGDLVKLHFRIRIGHLTLADNDPLEIRGWSFKVKVPVVFSTVTEVTEEPFRYYRDAFKRLNTRYSSINQFSLILKSMDIKSSEDDLDFGSSEPTTEQKQAFQQHIEFLLQPALSHSDFVLIYVGSRTIFKGFEQARPQQGWEKLLESADPANQEDIWTLSHFYPNEVKCRIQKKLGQQGEIHFAYNNFMCRSRGTGINTDTIIMPDTEGGFFIGMNALFYYLLRGTKAQVHYQQGDVKRIVSDVNGARLTISLISNKPGEIRMHWHYEMKYQQRFDMPVLGEPSRTFPTDIRLQATRVFHTKLLFGESSLRFEAERQQEPNPDQWLMTDLEGKFGDIPTKYPKMWSSMKTGNLHAEIIRDIQGQCVQLGGARCYKPIIKAYRDMIYQSHQSYKRLLELQQLSLRHINLALDGAQLFFQLPELFECEQARFDKQWNLIFNIRIKPEL